jgi:hypothetical protein
MTNPTPRIFGKESQVKLGCAHCEHLYNHSSNGAPNTQALHAACVSAVLSFPDVFQYFPPGCPRANPQRPSATKLCHGREWPEAEARSKHLQNLALYCHHARRIWRLYAYGEESKWYVHIAPRHHSVPRLELDSRAALRAKLQAMQVQNTASIYPAPILSFN